MGHRGEEDGCGDRSGRVKREAGRKGALCRCPGPLEVLSQCSEGVASSSWEVLRSGGARGRGVSFTVPHLMVLTILTEGARQDAAVPPGTRAPAAHVNTVLPSVRPVTGCGPRGNENTGKRFDGGFP